MIIGGIIAGGSSVVSSALYRKKIPEKIAPEVDKIVQVDIDSKQHAGTPILAREIINRGKIVEHNLTKKAEDADPTSGLKHLVIVEAITVTLAATPNLVGLAAAGELTRRRRQEKKGFKSDNTDGGIIAVT